MTNKSSRDTESEQPDELWESDLEDSFSPHDRTRPRRGLSGWQGVAIGIGVGLAIAAGAGILLPKLSSTRKPENKTQQAAPPSQTVTVAAAQTTRIARTLKTTAGTVEARDFIPVLPQATGLQVKQILVEDGQEVKAGQIMAVLDDSVLRTQIDGAKADIESKQALVQQKQATLQQAGATLADAERTLQRYQTLAKNGAISRQELDTRSTTAATAREAVSVAQANIGTAQADVRSSVARLQQLQTQLAQTNVRAPASGVVAEKLANVGDVSNGTQKLFSIIRNGELELEAKVPETELPQVRIDAPALITSSADSRVRLSGKVREIEPLVNESRQAIVKIDLPPTTLLRPGMSAVAVITTTTAVGVTVPSKAVLSQPDGSAIVFILSGEDKVQARKVEVGKVANGDSVEIKNNLQPGERVVVAGAGFVKDGDKVRVASP
jgi:RND family efflux transporter MFP subunit